MATYDWSLLYHAQGIDQKVEVFNHSVSEVIDLFCPEVTTRVRLNPKFYVSARCAVLSNEKNQEYRANKNSDRFNYLRREVKREIRESNICKIEQEVTKANGTFAWLKGIGKLGNRLGEKEKFEI